MQYKMLAIDMDDTLLSDDLTISKENQEAIQKAIKKGVKIVLCSGRASVALYSYLEQLNLKKDDEYAISYNGAITFKTKSLEIINQKNIKKEYAKYLFEFAKKENIYAQTYQGDYLFVEKANEYTKEYKRLTGMDYIEVGDLSEWVKEDIVKILFQGENKKLIKIKEKLEPWVREKLHMFISKPFYLEFTNINTNKGLALRDLRKRLGFKKEEVACIGDSFNDLYMIEEAHLGVAVANAHPEIKKRADYITKNDNNHGAVKEIIEKFIL
ncbi:Cof-type HAD-IIB family hydrolase [Defluviitalea phaphyphila]|uniref:Cof-type HAD-IIB family hydrolase n=1 Tax=Defluviitalea phaphyphila TaxID=1473580 RepID=UPI000730783B|nr:Cof-type HAD-IIB family hydrolase [Defluviitalea phaphyphila]